MKRKKPLTPKTDTDLVARHLAGTAKAQLDNFIQYMDGWCSATGRFVFNINDHLAALIEHLGCKDEVTAIIAKRAEEDRLKREAEEAKANELRDAALATQASELAEQAQPDEPIWYSADIEHLN